MDAPDTLQLAPAIDLATIGAVRRDLLERRGADLTIDAGAVEKIGGQGVQVLLAAQSAWEVDGKGLAFINASPAFLENLRLTGASSLLELCR